MDDEPQVTNYELIANARRNIKPFVDLAWDQPLAPYLIEHSNRRSVHGPKAVKLEEFGIGRVAGG